MRTNIFEQEYWGNDLLGTINGTGGGNIFLLGHTDTVYPVKTASSRPIRIEGDKIIGPGTSDMKGCILAAIYALEALFAIGYRSFGSIRFLCVSDEEIIQRHSVSLIREICSGCQGALVLKSARPNGDIVSARRGMGWYTLSASGRAAHAGVEPTLGRNAIVEIAHQLLQFQKLNGWREGISINPGFIQGGTTPNVVPDHAYARFDLRFTHPQDKSDTEYRWREIMQQKLIPEVILTLEAEHGLQEPMLFTEKSKYMISYAQEIASFLDFSVNHITAGGSSDASVTANAGIPTLDGLGPCGGNDHSPDEYLLKSCIPTRIAFLAGLIAAIGSADNE